MSTVPSKFKCDADDCKTQPVTFDEGANRSWFCVSLSREDKYVAINTWGRMDSIPTKLEVRHACSEFHAIEILKEFLLVLQ